MIRQDNQNKDENYSERCTNSTVYLW